LAREGEVLASSRSIGDPIERNAVERGPGVPAPHVAQPAGNGHAGAADPAPALDLVSRLCGELKERRVSFCHWKSNEALDRSASGENDLDLLVSRRDTQCFAEVLRRLGFKEARVRPAKQLPGVFHAYGLDAPSGRFVHVHAHYQLVIGDDMTKNYRLPLEEPYLASSVPQGVFMVPSAAWELAVFVVRMMLKHSTWDAMMSLQGSLAASEARELDDLSRRADAAELDAIVRQHLPFVDPELFEHCLECLRPGRSAWFRARTAARMQRRLAACSRRSRTVDTWLKLWRRAATVTRRFVLRRGTPKRLDAGGALIAIVGGDGAGKSSAVDGLMAWLSTGFETRRVHLGKPPRSATTVVLKGIMVLGRRAGRLSSTRIPAHGMRADEAARFPGYAWLLWHLLTARDRHREYASARRSATNGALVVCDRYPLPQLRFMDTARASELAGDPALGRIGRFMVRLEAGYYERISEPEIAIVLRVDPDVAVARRGDEEEAFVRPRCEEVWRADWSGSRAIVVDAGRTKEQVLSEVKSIVWSRL
jgi:thymidylate kinase